MNSDIFEDHVQSRMPSLSHFTYSESAQFSEFYDISYIMVGLLQAKKHSNTAGPHYPEDIQDTALSHSSGATIPTLGKAHSHSIKHRHSHFHTQNIIGIHSASAAQPFWVSSVLKTGQMV
jgi:hypothetical protein